MKKSLLFSIVSTFTLLPLIVVNADPNSNNSSSGAVEPSPYPRCKNDEKVICSGGGGGGDGDRGCNTSSGSGGTKPPKPIIGWIPQGSPLPPNCSRASKIDNASSEYFGYAVDFAIRNTPSGCSSCSGGVSSGNILPSLQVTRLMRPRYTDWQEGDLQASFGYGSYWQELDKTIRIGQDQQIQVNDPRDHDQSVYAIFEPARQAWVDLENSYFQTISLFDLDGNLITERSDSSKARSAIKLHITRQKMTLPLRLT